MAYESSKNSTKSGVSAKSTARLSSLQDTRSGLPTKSNSEVAFQECEEVEADLAALKVAYEQYFLGLERKPPTREHDVLKKRVDKLKSSFVRNTAAKFRVQATHNKFLSYERMWTRTLQEIENGTFKRDVLKAKKRLWKPSAPAGQGRASGPLELPEEDIPTDFDLDEAPAPVPAFRPPPPPPEAVKPIPFRGAPAVPPAPSVPTVAPLVPTVAPLVPTVAPLVPTPARGAPAVPPRPPAAPAAARPPAEARAAVPRPPAAPALRPPTAPSGPGGLSDDKLRAVYEAYVSAKKRNKEDTSKMSFDAVASTLRKQVPELMKQHNAKSVEFRVVLKDGKAVLKAVPK
jgi:hypothetical protein